MTGTRRAWECDVAVCGGGLAGAAVGRELASRGVAVLICERDTRTRRKPGELVAPNAAPFLEAFGLGPALRADPKLAIACVGIRSAWREGADDHRLFLSQPGGQAFAVDRLLLEEGVRSAAVAAGAAWLPGASIANPIRHDGIWRATVATAEGSVPLRARLLIDATGSRAGLARLLGVRRVRKSRLVALHAHWRHESECRSEAVLDVAAAPNGWRYAIETPGAHAVAFLGDTAELPRLAADRRQRLVALLGEGPTLCKQAHEAARRGVVCSVDAGASALLAASGEAWVAVGDAAASFDPMSSLGIAHAFASARAAARAVTLYLRGAASVISEYAAEIFKNWNNVAKSLASVYDACCFRDNAFYRRQVAELGT